MCARVAAILTLPIVLASGGCGRVGYDLASTAPDAPAKVQITTLAGPAKGAGDQDGELDVATLREPRALAVDPEGAVLFTDASERVRMLEGGRITSIAGSGAVGFRDGPAATATFHGVTGLAFASDDRVLIADRHNDRIRVLEDGQVSTLAGGRGFSDGPLSAVRFHQPAWLAVRDNGALVVSDTGNHALRELRVDGATATIAGGTYGTADGAAASAGLGEPAGIAVGARGEVLFADQLGMTLRQLEAGTVRTRAGVALNEGDQDGTGGAARLRFPAGIAVAADGTVYVADRRNHVVRVVRAGDVVITLAGSRRPGASDGLGVGASFTHPTDVKLDPTGRFLYVADAGNHRLRRITVATGEVVTLAGRGKSGHADGPAPAARFAEPVGISRGPDGLLYVGDALNHRVRVVDPATGRVTTLAGTGARGYADGPAATAVFNEIWGVRVGNAGELIVVDKENGCLRTVKDGVVATMPATARNGLNDPYDVVLLDDGTLVMSEMEGNKLWRIDAARQTRTVLAGGSEGFQDGRGASAMFTDPAGLALAPDGGVYVADTGNARIRHVTAAGEVTTVAGSTPGTADGPAGEARFLEPRAVAIAPNGDLFIADRTTVRRLSQGRVTTVVGATAVHRPGGMMVDADGSLLVVDTGNHAVRRLRF